MFASSIANFVVLLSCFTFVLSQCPPGSTMGLLDPRCYKFFDLPLSYTRAIDVCTRNNGQLASIPNELVNNYLAGQANRYFLPFDFTSFWIGANDMAVLNQWVWQDGLPWGFVKWEQGHPLQDDTVHDCGAMWIDRPLWFSANCAEEKPFACVVGFLPTPAPHQDPKPQLEEIPPTAPATPPEVPAAPPAENV